MSLRVWIGATLLLVASPVLAQHTRALEIEMVNPARFTRAQLITALALRLAPDGPPVTLAIISAGAGDQIIIERGHVRRTVELGDRTGDDAARLVALAASDLVLDDLATPPPPPIVPVPSRWTLAALGVGAAWAHAELGGQLELTIPHGDWRARVAVGEGATVGGAVRVGVQTLRVGVARRVGWVEVGVHAIVAPVEVTAGAGDVTALVGGGAAIRTRWPLTPSTAIVIEAGVDAFATQTQYAQGPTAVTQTPWLAPWVAVGAEVAL